MKLSLEGLEALEAIADEGSFAAAAARLHKVQSAVSYQVGQLESALGLTLFDRSGHRAALTPVGAQILEEARSLLSRARRLEGLASRFAAGWEPRLQVIVDGALPTGPLLEALAALGGADLPTHIQLRTEFLGGVARRFQDLPADLMVGLLDGPEAGLEVVRLPSLAFALVASPRHPAAMRGVLSPEALQEHVELSVHDSDEATGARDTNLIAGARVFYVGDFSAKREGLCRGLGVGWMPVHAIEAELASGQLIELSVALGSRRSFPVSIASRVDRPLGPAGSALRDELRRRLTTTLSSSA